MPPLEGCPSRDDLQRFVQGNVDDEEAQAVESHLLQCRQCVDTAATVATVIGLMPEMAVDANAKESSSLGELQKRLKSLWGQKSSSRAQESVAPHIGDRALDLQGAEYREFLRPPEPGSDELGRLGPYRVRRVLGTGGMGLVFVARDEKLKREVALKVLKPALAADPESRGRFLREAQAAAALRNDHVIEIYQVDEDRGIPFLVMPLLKGETLESRLATAGRLPLPSVLRIGKEIADGLAAAHKSRLIHRDIKPGNIWLEQGTDRVKILDFGLAREINAEVKLTNPDTILGSAAYMSPEQAEPGKRPLDERSDLFGLGCVLYEMATGVGAFARKGLLETLKAVIQVQPQAPDEIVPTLPPSFSILVTKLLSKDPDGRPPSATAVVRLLESLQSANDRTATPDTPQTIPRISAGDSNRRRPKRGWMVAASVAAIAVLTGGYFLFGAQLIRIVTNKGLVVVEVDDPRVDVTVKENTVVVQDRPGARQITLVAGDHSLEVTVQEASGEMRFFSKTFTLIRGDRKILNVRQELSSVPSLDLAPFSDSGDQSHGPRVGPIVAPAEPPPNHDRQVAEWVLSVGGRVSLDEGGKQREFKSGDPLPAGEIHLVSVNLRERQLTEAGFQLLESSRGLVQLNLELTNVTDAWLSHIRGLASLHDLQLGGTQISDSGLEHIGGLKELRGLNLWGTRVTDAGLAHLSGLTRLVGLTLDGTQVTGVGFAHLQGLKQMVYLAVAETQVDDATIQHIRDLPIVQNLKLARTKVTDAGLSRLRGMAGLWYLHLGGLPITDRGLASLGIEEMPWLTHLILRHTEVTDASLPTILKAQRLEEIDLTETNVSAQSFATLKKVYPHAKISWSEPNHTAAMTVLACGGTVSVHSAKDTAQQFIKNRADLPVEFFEVTQVNLAKTACPLSELWPTLLNPRLKALALLDLSDRPITDSDLQAIKDLKHLRRLVLDRTNIHGQGLVYLQRLPQLKELSLNCRSLDLLIIESGGFSKLERLSLSKSSISDSAIEHLIKLDGLKELDLTETKVTSMGIAALKKSCPKCRIVGALSKP
jgi:serine/threonine protein kinase/Leucine-rich repeat (LRR) protein